MLPRVERSDADLVLEARSGDQAAFAELFDRHGHRVAGACRQHLRSDTDIDDAVQEAFARALANLHQLRDGSTFGAWVRSIAVRACMDHHRAARRVIHLDGDLELEVEDAAPLPDEVLETAERQASIRNSLRELGTRDRQALWLRHVGEAPVSVVASHLGMTEGSTRVMLARARQRFRAAAAGIGLLLPPSWRQWLRDHVQVPLPAADALAMAMAFTIAAGVGGPVVASARQPEPRPAAVQQQERRPDRKAPVRRADGDQQQAGKRRSDRAAPTGSAAAPVSTTRAAVVSAAAAEPPHRRLRPLRRVDKSVDFSREYPDEDESSELLDVTVFADDEEGNVRLFADDLGPAGDAAVKAYDTVGGRD